MINFRFHIVSLTAVLLALGVGLVLGTAFLDDALISTLRTQLDGLEGDLERERERGADQRLTIGQLEGEHDALDVELGSHVLAGSMEDEPVLFVTREGVEDELVDRAMGAFEQADADVIGTWVLQSDLALDDDDAVERLSEALDVATDDAERLRDNVVGQLSDVLYGSTDASQSADEGVQSLTSQEDQTDPGDEGGPGEGDGGAADAAGGQDAGQGDDTVAATGPEEDGEPHEPLLLEMLRDAGFVEYRFPDDHDGDTVLVPGEGLRVVVVDGYEAELSDDLLYDMLTSLAADGPVPAVVAGPGPMDLDDDSDDDEETPEVSPLVQRVREDELAERVATVDNLDRAPGQVAVVLAAQAAQPGAPHIDHYGQGEGAERLLPPTDALPQRDE